MSDEDLVDRLCDEFDQGLRDGCRVPIKVQLELCPERLQGWLFSELLQIELEYTPEDARNALLADYATRFAGFRKQLESLRFTIDKPQGTPSDPAPQRAGDSLRNFELQRIIAEGASGVVWLAIDQRLGRCVAIKIPKADALIAEDRLCFLREAQAAGQLSHANIVSVHEADVDDGVPYIVADFVEGTSLKDQLAASPLAPSEAAALCATVADALHHAHQRGVVHRDIKPSNILIDAAGTPYVSDFGLAKLLADENRRSIDGQLIGTPAYMSPEQARGETSKVDHRSDIFSLGVVLFEMVTQRLPFEGKPAAVLSAIASTAPPRCRDLDKSVPVEIDAICRRCMEFRVADRYESAGHLAEDLRGFLAGGRIAAMRSRPFRGALRGLRRHSRSLLAALGVVAALVAFSLGLLRPTPKIASGLSVDGFRQVRVSTSPAAARVAFIPIRAATAAPSLEDIVLPPVDSGGATELEPGYYLVVAATADGRFHEVLRYVPRIGQEVEASGYLSSRASSGGSIQLPSISIPETDVVAGMAFVEGTDCFTPGDTNLRGLPGRCLKIKPFFVDRVEQSVGRTPKSILTTLQQQDNGEEAALVASFHQAATVAESLGKRLPTEFEFEYLATNFGRHAFPWGDEFPDPVPAAPSSGSRHALFDVLNATEPVRGLCSGVAEWTLSPGLPSFGVPNDLRVVRGGNRATIAGDFSVTAEVRGPTVREAVHPHTTAPGLGFRCVRSAVPMISYEGMVAEE